MVDNSKNGVADVRAYAQAQQSEVDAVTARARFHWAAKGALCPCDLETDGQVDFRKLNRLANRLVGRPASDKPEPTAEEWQNALTALAEEVGHRMEPEE